MLKGLDRFGVVCFGLLILWWPILGTLKTPQKRPNKTTTLITVNHAVTSGVQETLGLFPAHVWFTILRLNVFEPL